MTARKRSRLAVAAARLVRAMDREQTAGVVRTFPDPVRLSRFTVMVKAMRATDDARAALVRALAQEGR